MKTVRVKFTSVLCITWVMSARFETPIWMKQSLRSRTCLHGALILVICIVTRTKYMYGNVYHETSLYQDAFHCRMNPCEYYLLEICITLLNNKRKGVFHFKSIMQERSIKSHCFFAETFSCLHFIKALHCVGIYGKMRCTYLIKTRIQYPGSFPKCHTML